MIEKDIRQGDREKNLLNALLKLNRVKLDEGGPVKPLTLADYLKVGIQNSSLSEDERKEIQALLDDYLSTDSSSEMSSSETAKYGSAVDKKLNDFLS